MPKTEKKPAGSKTSASKKAVAKKAAGGGKAAALSQADAEAILKSFHRVLRNKEVEHPIELRLATDDGEQCLKWDCRTINGELVCDWFPC
jgi:hypothetical protein